jgi:hypothetical protein
MGTDFDPHGAARKRIERYAVTRVVGSPIAPYYLAWFEMLHGATEHTTRRIVEGYIQMGLGRVFGLQALDDVALDDERTIFPFQPDFFRPRRPESRRGRV